MNNKEADHFYALAQAYVSELADKADCLEAVDEIRSLKIEDCDTALSNSFNEHIDAVCDDLEKLLNVSQATPKPIEEGSAVRNPKHLKKMIKLWETYIEENKCAIIEAENDDDQVAIKEYQKEIEQHLKDIAKYKKLLEELV